MSPRVEHFRKLACYPDMVELLQRTAFSLCVHRSQLLPGEIINKCLSFANLADAKACKELIEEEFQIELGEVEVVGMFQKVPLDTWTLK